ncbi:bifunctional riboflavin kinase/FAD synthetase [Mangrovivirga sp. M17]|uniref:Riboflavin biosynthesis protein n=1 Tax=Mangrovivirga halotolerans TaxID=2993936 RepID=A0ABT3RTY8_9BACT|nr:bifunctional riboflavin kinase/FAD synthetase [Mangrovivirga halotolerans]MCX2745244.1 bifunctional riboflavin kinase/FAD synthetase [Mangrovivirga halotolerans]
MKIYEGLTEFSPPDFPVVTSGTFDGVHKGHQKIIERIKTIADKNNGETVLITYWPHPRFVLNPDDDSLKLLNTFEEKAALLEEMGIDHLIKFTFDKKFSSQTSEEFIKNILIDGIKTKKLVIGYDHRFGKNREGSFEHLKENAGKYGFEVEEIPEQDVNNVAVSSTKIRKALDEGEVEVAREYLGKDYSITGFVGEGEKRGRELGFPTANITIPEKFKEIPANGVYGVHVQTRGKSYKGMMNIGVKPTFSGKQRSLEVHLFNFDDNIYGEKVTVYFDNFVRKEKKFNNTEELIKQLQKDKQVVLNRLNQ